MKSFNEQSKELTKFDENFDTESYDDCVTRAMLLIKNRKAQMIEEGYEWNVSISSCKWAIEQAILNRQGTSMVAAAIEYVEYVEGYVEAYNNIDS